MNPNMVMSPRASLREALEAITKNGRQAVLVADAEGVLAGMVTDGELERAGVLTRALHSRALVVKNLGQQNLRGPGRPVTAEGRLDLP